MWWYYEIIQKVTLDVIGSDRTWARTKEEAQEQADARCRSNGDFAGEVKPLNDDAIHNEE